MLAQVPIQQGGSARLSLRELVRRRPVGGDEEISFRQDLVRQAAYASLTPADRKAAHKLAALWLEQSGDASPLGLAEHHERGGDPERAAGWYQRAAELALEGNDFAQAIANLERGIACGQRGEALATAKRTLALAHRWLGDAERSYEAASEALSLATQGDLPAPWAVAYRAAADVAFACGRTGRHAELHALAERLLSARDPEPALTALHLSTLAIAARATGSFNERDLTERLMRRLEAVLATQGALPPDLAADVANARAMDAMQREDFESFLRHSEARRDASRAADNVRVFCEASNSLGFACLIVGANARSEVVLREGIDAAARLGLRREAAACRSNLSLVLLRTRRADEALAEVRAAVATARTLKEVVLLAAVELDLAEVHLQRGELDAAEEAARAAHAHAERRRHRASRHRPRSGIVHRRRSDSAGATAPTRRAPANPDAQNEMRRNPGIASK